MTKHRTRIFIDSLLHHRIILALNQHAGSKRVDCDRFIHETLSSACRALERAEKPPAENEAEDEPECHIDPDRLEFPSVLAPYIGLQTTQIAFMKRKGCPFYGRKTTLRWVRDFIEEQVSGS